MKQMKYKVAAGVVLLAVAASGCTATDPVRVESDFGNSVWHMINAQLHDPKAAQNPPADAPAGMDGVHAGAVLKAYRERAGDADGVDEDVQLNVSP